MIEATLPFPRQQDLLVLFGTKDQNLRLLRDQLRVNVTHGDGSLVVRGDEPNVHQATDVLEQLKNIVQRSGELSFEETKRVVDRVTGVFGETMDTEIDVMAASQPIVPRTAGQARYIKAIRENDLVFALGPAGTGKTFLAVALAVEALKHKLIRKIVLVRPAVEAGESLGFLPGDMHAKINPYLRPLLDSLHSMIDFDVIQEYMEKDVIEVVPLAYMRGRTLDEAFIILDEAQNATISQMKMFLTRMGAKSKIVVSGDGTQIDLPKNVRSGLLDATRRLASISGVAAIKLDASDIVRHRLVQEIVDAYEPVDDSARKRKK
ncbi:MAG: phosphate starvation-inducible protein PhoH [Rhodopirellula sp.]|nr:phosphate starvation-inducible protein PhoH [Rhodopirellula sp.]MBL99074.1 phosphate starvation-inducible protein PhoH [Rhodopirellula sp.]MCH2600956.1 PhoH family protein [Pirellulales bacterium]HCA51183.1 PhoH family protein [Planctomycetaceae bacterium]|tara:strand:+ start:4191 stop:5150 length:960 start_codon:yes stop_codon:yes gene_type:complete